VDILKVAGAAFLIIQVLAAAVLIFIIAIQTTKSEQSGAGMGGWGTIGGQASSQISKFGLDAQLTRITTWTAIVFFVVSIMSAYMEALIRHAAK
jgi:protein translocase SecG subunit